MKSAKSTVTWWVAAVCFAQVVLPFYAVSQTVVWPDIRSEIARDISGRSDPGDTYRIARVEGQMIMAAKGGVERKGGNLTLHFENGTSKTYVNKQDCEGMEGACQSYLFVGLVAKTHYFLVHEQFYEGVGCLVVDSRTGHETELPDVPYLSPDGERLLVLNGLDGGGVYWPLQIWRRRGDGLFLEWKLGDEQLNPLSQISVLNWDQNDQINLLITSQSSNQPPMPNFRAMQSTAGLTLTSQGWTFSSGLFKDRK